MSTRTAAPATPPRAAFAECLKECRPRGPAAARLCKVAQGLPPPRPRRGPLLQSVSRNAQRSSCWPRIHVCAAPTRKGCKPAPGCGLSLWFSTAAKAARRRLGAHLHRPGNDRRMEPATPEGCSRRATGFALEALRSPGEPIFVHRRRADIPINAYNFGVAVTKMIGHPLFFNILVTATQKPYEFIGLLRGDCVQTSTSDHPTRQFH